MLKILIASSVKWFNLITCLGVLVWNTAFFLLLLKHAQNYIYPAQFNKIGKLFSLSVFVRKKARLSWDLCKINLPTSVTLISETRGSPSHSALAHLHSLYTHTHSSPLWSTSLCISSPPPLTFSLFTAYSYSVTLILTYNLTSAQFSSLSFVIPALLMLSAEVYVYRSFQISAWKAIVSSLHWLTAAVDLFACRSVSVLVSFVFPLSVCSKVLCNTAAELPCSNSCLTHILVQNY